jgi:hypothetical protein
MNERPKVLVVGAGLGELLRDRESIRELLLGKH